MGDRKLKVNALKAECLIIGGGAAGCTAANILAKSGRSVILAEKAAISRSGCLAAGVNAINAWVGQGKSPQDYADYAFQDAHGIASMSLLLSMSERLEGAIKMLEALGLVFQKEPDGSYKSRSWRNIKVNGENIKPLLAFPLKTMKNITLVEHVHVSNLLLSQDSGEPVVSGALGFSTHKDGGFYIFGAKAVIVATGGAAGIYMPNNQGISQHKMWYPPFNTGGGYAMGILAGAELSTLEMRFVALRLKDTMAPTGTLSLGAGAHQVNSLGENYEAKYGNSTSDRVLALRRENEEGRGPCRLVAKNESGHLREGLSKAYFHMSPLQSLRFLEDGTHLKKQNLKDIPKEGGDELLGAFIEGSEPFVMGGHTASGYVIGPGRETSLKGLYAAGDAAFGAPQKYVSGSMAEAMIAAESVSLYLQDLVEPKTDKAQLEKALSFASKDLTRKRPPYGADGLEEAMQKAMDREAGGRSSGYRYTLNGLKEARKEIDRIYTLSLNLAARDLKELSRNFELRERLIVARSLICHLMNRKETRWPGFGEYQDYPKLDSRYELFLNTEATTYGGCYPEEGLVNLKLSARDLIKLESVPLPDVQEDPPEESQ
ncbi:MAG: adenylyl-sulfate reductase subunit alpha [Deltaproteobacteria bacterium]|nr:adenylyl-sulfate reductase subunit alpha [Deltaproteobacteria bacterium]